MLELVIVISIMIFLSAIILPNYQAAASRFALERSAYKLAQDIRRAAEMAMSAKEFGGTVPKGGYGIYLEAGNPNYCLGSQPTCYIIYADKDGNEFFTETEIIESPYIELEKGVVIQGINTLPNKIGINFKPPAPFVKIKYTSADEVAEVKITLALEADSTKTRTVKVNKAGLIDVE